MKKLGDRTYLIEGMSSLYQIDFAIKEGEEYPILKFTDDCGCRESREPNESIGEFVVRCFNSLAYSGCVFTTQQSKLLHWKDYFITPNTKRGLIIDSEINLGYAAMALGYSKFKALREARIFCEANEQVHPGPLVYIENWPITVIAMKDGRFKLSERGYVANTWQAQQIALVDAESQKLYEQASRQEE